MCKFSKFIFVAAIAAAFTLTACDNFGKSGIDFTDKDQIESKLLSRIIDEISPESIVLQMSFSGGADEITKHMTYATIAYFEPGSADAKEITVYLDNTGSRESSVVPLKFRKRTPDSGIMLMDVDLSLIAGYIADAGEFVDESDEYNFDGIGTYTIEIPSGDPSKVTHKFSIESKDETTMTTKNGRRVEEISYYEFHFQGDAEGTLEYLEN